MKSKPVKQGLAIRTWRLDSFPMPKWFFEIDWTVVATIGLIIVTAYYAWSTRNILKESEKTRAATEQLAKSSEESTQLLRQQIEDAAGLGKEIIRSAYQTASFNINYWKAANISNLTNLNALPSSIDLVPPDAQSAVYHARKISAEGAEQLSVAFDKLRIAENEIEILKESKTRGPGFVDKHTKRALDFIEKAFEDLEKAADCFKRASVHIKEGKA